MGRLPKSIITDAGYRSEENYEYPEEKRLGRRVPHRLNELKRKANENLCSDKVLKLRSQRAVEVEQGFGRIKGCW